MKLLFDVLENEWMKPLFRRIRKEKCLEVRGPSEAVSMDGSSLVKRYYLYTDNYKYSITARIYENGRSYLGCVVSARKSLPGENWHRGNDLADGKFTYETWLKILNDIVAYELVPLAEKYEPLQDTEEEK